MTNFAASVEWKRLFQVITAITLACVMLGSLADDAEARKRKKRVQGYTPPYAEMVVDINSGRVLRAVNADAPRFPASITKVMTLYLLFEQIEKGRMSLSTPLEVSAFAASQAPSKLGLRPGSRIAAEDAILALVTKSANDVAVTVAENISGSQDDFARLMTRKARQLGMSKTTFKNASGLPNPNQSTTARDLVRLGVAMKRDFPQFYGYFQTRSFTYRGNAYRNHNRLLGRVEGVDGIKTGYTRASGFNLLTSARSGNRQIMTVVLGGRSGGARDARVAQLVMANLGKASNRANPALAERQLAALETVSEPEDGAPVAAPVVEKASSTKLKGKTRPAVITAEATTPAETTVAAYAEVKPQLVGPAVLRSRKDKRRLTADKTRVAAIIAEAKAKESKALDQEIAEEAAPAPKAARTKKDELRWVVSEEPAKLPAGKSKRAQKVKIAATDVDAVDQAAVTNSIAPKAKAAGDEKQVTAKAPQAKPAAGWIIQLAAAENEQKALKVLDKAKAKQGRLLASAVPFTEPVQKGESTLWRARFGGFDSADAQAACSALKKSGFSCLAQRA